MIEGLQVVGSVVGGIVAPIAAYFIKDIKQDIKENEQHVEKLKDSHQNFQLEVHREFAKEINVQLSLDRIHKRIDEVGTDIKKLLGQN